jgi:hypothetical protein
MRLFGRLALVVGSVAIVGAIVAPVVADAQGPASCDWEVEYAVAANLKLTDTPMGEGDGVYPIGPGKVLLRWQNQNGQPGGEVKMLEYRMREYFTIKSRTLFWTTTVVTDTNTAATPNVCSIAADGAFDGAARTIKWRTPVRGYRTDGTLTCEGSLCGKFGAPPPGQSPLHIGPSDIWFKPFVFGSDLKTFTMATTHVSKTDMPKQSGEVALAGREVRRACVPVAQCTR